MANQNLNYFIDVCLLILFIINIIAAYARWRYIHELTGNILIILLLIHLSLHWRWFVAATKNLFYRQN